MAVPNELAIRKNGRRPQERVSNDGHDKLERTTRVMSRAVEMTPDTLSERVEAVLNILEVDWDQVTVEVLTGKSNKLVVQILGFPKTKYHELISHLSKKMHFQAYTSESYQEKERLLIDVEIRPVMMNE